MDTQPIGPFLGINNRLPDFAMRVQDKGSFLRDAVNVDIDNSGSARSRNGVTLVQAMTGAHSLNLKTETDGFLVRGGTLYSIDLSSGYSETLVKVLSNDNIVHYAEQNGSVYYSNTVDSGRIDETGAWLPWAIPTPAAPSVSTIAGALPIGAYHVAVRYINQTTGEAGGISASTVADADGTTAFRVSLPSATAGATHVQLFVTKLNGSQPYLHSTYATGTATGDVTTTDSVTTTAEPFLAEPMPACHSLQIHMGRMIGANGKTLYYGLPYRFGYYDANDGYIEFEDNITVLAPNQYGLFVATANKTYWFAGDVSKIERITDPLPYGGVFNTVFSVPHEKLLGWFGDKGIVIGDEQGQVSAEMQNNVDVTLAGFPYAGVFEDNGYRRVVSCGYCMNLENGAVTRYEDYGVVSISRGYGTTVDGLYLLSGTSVVDSTIDLGKENFGVENKKALPAAYVGAASSEPLVLVVTLPDGSEYEYPARSCSDTIEINRIDTGKGLRENWYGLKIKNDRGSSFTLASVSFAPVASGRRI
jgi:hypothetical protein